MSRRISTRRLAEMIDAAGFAEIRWLLLAGVTAWLIPAWFLSRPDRDAVPLVVDAADRIVWVAGHGIDEAFRVTDPAQAVVIFKVRRV